jgi:hypothetical protein
MDIYNVNIKFKFDKKYALDIENRFYLTGWARM